MNSIEHIGIAVKDLAVSEPLYERLLNTKSYKKELVASQLVTTLFFQVGQQKIELLEASSPESTLAAFIAKKGEGIHHIAFKVDDIREEMARLRREGFVLLDEEPRPGADNKLICFVHPKSAGGVLIELCQDHDR